MKKLVIILLVLLCVLPALASGVQRISSKEVRTLLARKGNLFLLDVRTPEEYRQGRLQGAVLIPIAELQQRLGEIPRNRPILVYCAVGGRSNRAAALLSVQGFPEVYDMSDGIAGWGKNGLPLER